MDTGFQQWCHIQTRMLEALKSNLTFLVRDNIPQLETYQQQVASINIKVSRDAALIARLKLLLDAYGAANFVRILEHAVQCRTCATATAICVPCKLIAQHSLTNDHIASFLHMLKAHMRESA